jgi:hypothetical protein
LKKRKEVEMYSPKIAEELVPVLYRLAKDRKMPMTRLVNGIIRDVLADKDLPNGSADTDCSSLHVCESVSSPKAAA